MKTYKTIADVEAAGYTVRLTSRHLANGGIRIVDISGPNCFGYDFAVHKITDDGCTAEVPVGKSFYLSEEKNRVGQTGVVVIRATPEEIDAAIETVKNETIVPW